MMHNSSFLCNTVQNTPDDCTTSVLAQDTGDTGEHEAEVEDWQSGVKISVTKKHHFSQKGGFYYLTCKRQNCLVWK